MLTIDGLQGQRFGRALYIAPAIIQTNESQPTFQDSETYCIPVFDLQFQLLCIPIVVSPSFS
jgi:hypothetical protein